MFENGFLQDFNHTQADQLVPGQSRRQGLQTHLDIYLKTTWPHDLNIIFLKIHGAKHLDLCMV
jgi:hypothetical protein